VQPEPGPETQKTRPHLTPTGRNNLTDPQQPWSTGIFGIDLGTTYSEMGNMDAAIRAPANRNSDGEDNILVGQVAKDSSPACTQIRFVLLIKDEMGDPEYRRTFFGVEHAPPSISAINLKALASDAEVDTGRKVTDVVVTVRAYFGLLGKDATRQAGEIAVLNVIGIAPSRWPQHCSGRREVVMVGGMQGAG